MTLGIFSPGPPAASTMPKVVDYFGMLHLFHGFFPGWPSMDFSFKDLSVMRRSADYETM